MLKRMVAFGGVAHSLIAFIVFVSTFLYTSGNCPNMCNGHGVCTTDNVCVCESFYEVASDCSQKSCPTGNAWASKGNTSNFAHLPMECSNIGVCDYGDGTCVCPPGFEGDACERTVCGSDNCNNHGSCLPLEHLYNFYSIGSVVGNYSTWDGKSLTACFCDYGFTGADCSMRMCPKGDDPLTPSIDFRTIQISITTTSGTLSGEFKFVYNGQSFSFPASGWSSVLCKEAFEDMMNIETVKCEILQHPNGRTNNYDITVNFIAFPTNPYENNFIINDGDPDISEFTCDSSKAVGTGAACALIDISGVAFPEYLYCSNRGICNFQTGTCTCYEDFYGASCSTYAPLSYTATVGVAGTSDVLELRATKSDFASSILRLSTDESASSDFALLRVNDNYRNVFVIDGNGNTLVNYGEFTIKRGGMLISAGGLKVSGGLTVPQHGFHIASGMTVFSDGLKIYNSGGLVVAGGMTVFTGGLKVTGGLTMDEGMMVIDDGLEVTDGGATINAGGVSTTGGLSVYTSGMNVMGGLTVNSGNILVSQGGLSMYTGGVHITGGLSVNDAGIKVTGGMTVESDGIWIEEKGLSVKADGIHVSNGLTVQTLGVQVTSGVTIQGGGLITPGTLTVVTDGMSVGAGGIILDGPFTVNNNGMRIEGGVSIEGSALTATGGISIGESGEFLSLQYSNLRYLGKSPLHIH